MLVTKESIAEEVVPLIQKQGEGMTKESVLTCIDSAIEYMNKVNDSENNIVVIKIPFFGVVYMNYQLSLSKLSEKTLNEKQKKALYHKVMYLKKVLKDSKNKSSQKTFNTSNVVYFYNVATKKAPYDAHKNLYKYWDKLAEIHNKNHKKYFE